MYNITRLTTARNTWFQVTEGQEFIDEMALPCKAIMPSWQSETMIGPYIVQFHDGSYTEVYDAVEVYHHWSKE